MIFTMFENLDTVTLEDFEAALSIHTFRLDSMSA